LDQINLAMRLLLLLLFALSHSHMTPRKRTANYNTPIIVVAVLLLLALSVYLGIQVTRRSRGSEADTRSNALQIAYDQWTQHVQLLVCFALGTQ
jgi:steroid 5-alpha reductase family enzyme